MTYCKFDAYVRISLVRMPSAGVVFLLGVKGKRVVSREKNAALPKAIPSEIRSQERNRFDMKEKCRERLNGRKGFRASAGEKVVQSAQVGVGGWLGRLSFTALGNRRRRQLRRLRRWCSPSPAGRLAVA